MFIVRMDPVCVRFSHAFFWGAFFSRGLFSGGLFSGGFSGYSISQFRYHPTKY